MGARQRRLEVAGGRAGGGELGPAAHCEAAGGARAAAELDVEPAARAGGRSWDGEDDGERGLAANRRRSAPHAARPQRSGRRLSGITLREMVCVFDGGGPTDALGKDGWGRKFLGAQR